MKTPNPEDFPFADLLFGTKKKKPQSEEEKTAQAFLDLAKKHPKTHETPPSRMV